MEVDLCLEPMSSSRSSDPIRRHGFILNSRMSRAEARARLQGKESPMTTVSYVGIDVSKRRLDIAGCDRHLLQVENLPKSHKSLARKLLKWKPLIVAIEATGGYERQLSEHLIQAGLPVAVVQPSRVRHYAKSIGLLAKTDPIDARLIARFAEATKPRLTDMPDPSSIRLRSLRDRRDQVVEDRVREESRLESCADAQIRRRIQATIRRLRREEAMYDREIAGIIQADEVLAEKDAVMRAVIGVGPQTSATILSHLPEIGTLGRQQIAALAGLAPYDRSSGKWEGRRSIYAGRAQVRRVLYMAAVSACRHNPVLKEHYLRLRSRGKEAKVALVACARKLVIRLNTLIFRHNLTKKMEAVPA